MLLTRKELEKYLQMRRITIPADMKRDLLHQYGNLAVDEEGQPREYTEQDISEQLRKLLVKYDDCQEREN
jgi:hypothetical protein